jgi:hypothetical protein
MWPAKITRRILSGKYLYKKIQEESADTELAAVLRRYPTVPCTTTSMAQWVTVAPPILDIRPQFFSIPSRQPSVR